MRWRISGCRLGTGTPARSGSSRRSMPSSAARSMRCRNSWAWRRWHSVKSRSSITCRSVLPPDTSTTVAPIASKAVVGTRTAGGQAVAEGVLDDVAPADAGRGKGAQHRRRPHLDILLGAGHHDRNAVVPSSACDRFDLRQAQQRTMDHDCRRSVMRGSTGARSTGSM